MTSVTHQQLLSAAASGDDDALASLVRAYHDRVYRFGLRVCRDGFDADDAVQEAFSKLSRRPDVLRGTSTLSWLFAVVESTCRRLLRPLSRQRLHLGERVAEDVEIPTEALEPLAALERFELVQAVHAALARLERPYREVLVLRDLEGMSGPEVCTALGLAPAAMKSRLHRARGQLRLELRRGA